MEHRLIKPLYRHNSNKLFSDKLMVLICNHLKPSFSRQKEAELVKTQRKLLLMFLCNYLTQKKNNSLMTHSQLLVCWEMKLYRKDNPKIKLAILAMNPIMVWLNRTKLIKQKWAVLRKCLKTLTNHIKFQDQTQEANTQAKI
jgi:hypothetical protein